jgi:hypothetical protein
MYLISLTASRLVVDEWSTIIMKDHTAAGIVMENPQCKHSSNTLPLAKQKLLDDLHPAA